MTIRLRIQCRVKQIRDTIIREGHGRHMTSVMTMLKTNSTSRKERGSKCTCLASSGQSVTHSVWQAGRQRQADRQMKEEEESRDSQSGRQAASPLVCPSFHPFHLPFCQSFYPFVCQSLFDYFFYFVYF